MIEDKIEWQSASLGGQPVDTHLSSPLLEGQQLKQGEKLTKAQKSHICQCTCSQPNSEIAIYFRVEIKSVHWKKNGDVTFLYLWCSGNPISYSHHFFPAGHFYQSQGGIFRFRVRSLLPHPGVEKGPFSTWFSPFLFL